MLGAYEKSWPTTESCASSFLVGAVVLSCRRESAVGALVRNQSILPDLGSQPDEADVPGMTE